MEKEKRICLINVVGTRNMVMSEVYTEYLKEHDIKYDIIVMTRHKEKDKVAAEHYYNYEANMSNVFTKIYSYIKYHRYVQELLDKNDYSFVIVWGEVTAVLLSDLLRGRKYYGKYCVNIRDLLMGKRKLFNIRLNDAICAAAFTTVSSDKYLTSLPSGGKNYLYFHSFNKKIMKGIEQEAIEKCKRRGIIRIVFVGSVRFHKHFLRLIDEIKNDKRYRFIIAGSNDNKIAEYVSENNIQNVDVFGTFEVERTREYLLEADALYNLYGTENINLRYALSNKLYYAICLNIPILAYKDTYTYEVADRLGIGYAVDDSYERHSFADDFYCWYQKRDLAWSKKKCEELIGEAIESQRVLLKCFERAINKV